MASLYFHIPFCRQACSYCNFHFSTLMKSYDDTIGAFYKEMELRKNFPGNHADSFDTIYFGGGTPSLLRLDDLRGLFDEMGRFFSFEEKPEVTLEVNPEDVNKENSRAWYSMGVNRISMGIQSFFEDDLHFLNRCHDSGQVFQAMNYLRQAGFQNISVDLILGLPGSRLKKWQQNLEFLFGLDVPHFCAYSLTVEPKTLLNKQIERGVVTLPDDSEVFDQFQILRDQAINQGYEHYEISGFAKPGWYSRHNSSYWQGIPYLGIGPGSHSYDGVKRSWNVANNYHYIKALRRNELPFEEEKLSITDRYNEFLLTRLRTAEGFSLKALSHNFGGFYLDYFFEQARPYFEKHLLVRNGDQVYIPGPQLFISDEVISSLFYVP